MPSIGAIITRRLEIVLKKREMLMNDGYLVDLYISDL